jgi:hypothetical protein
MAEAIAQWLTDLGADPILVEAARRNRIVLKECMWEGCDEPQGRGYFTPAGPRSSTPHMPSADRYPLPGRYGGEYDINNVRLLHYRCNCRQGGLYSGPIQGPKHVEKMLANLTPEALARGQANGCFTSHYAQTPEGKEQRRRASHLGHTALVASGWYESARLKAIGTALGQSGKGKPKSPAHKCKMQQSRWGKPCVCGQHPLILKQGQSVDYLLSSIL